MEARRIGSKNMIAISKEQAERSFPEGRKWGHSWLPVSATWAAAGRLLDALALKHPRTTIIVGYGPSGKRRTGRDWVAQVDVGKTGDHHQERADSGPMALCLAVAELAKAGKEGKL